jgi:hypothetical protein
LRSGENGGELTRADASPAQHAAMLVALGRVTLGAMTVHALRPGSTGTSGDDSRLLLWFGRIISPTIAITLLGSFVSYVYEVGLCSRFHVPLWFARPEWMTWYQVLLIGLIVGVTTGLPALGISSDAKTARRLPPPMFRAVAYRIVMALAAGVFVSCFYSSAGSSWQGTVVMTIVFCIALAFSTVGLCLGAARRALAATRGGRRLMLTRLGWLVRPYAGGAPRRRSLEERDFLLQVGGGPIVAVAFIIGCIGMSYQIGFRSADQMTGFLFLTGRIPEIVLLQYADSYVTAEFEPKSRTIVTNFRWHALSEGRRMSNVAVGRLVRFRAETCCGALTSPSRLLVPRNLADLEAGTAEANGTHEAPPPRKTPAPDS